jgi:hypothetical protein
VRLGPEADRSESSGAPGGEADRVPRELRFDGTTASAT